MKKSKQPSSLAASKTSLVQAVEKLDGKNAVNFTIENLRLCIGQNHRLDELMPVALEALQENPLAEGVLYPGDLLNSVLKIPKSYWDTHAKQKANVLKIVRQVDFGDAYQADSLVQAMRAWLYP